jgi:hypothetical protein
MKDFEIQHVGVSLQQLDFVFAFVVRSRAPELVYGRCVGSPDPEELIQRIRRERAQETRPAGIGDIGRQLHLDLRPAHLRGRGPGGVIAKRSREYHAIQTYPSPLARQEFGSLSCPDTSISSTLRPRVFPQTSGLYA